LEGWPERGAKPDSFDDRRRQISLRITRLGMLVPELVRDPKVVLPEILFDMDYPGHYMRRIKSASVSLQCVAGPFQGVHGALRLQGGSTRKTPSGEVSDLQLTFDGHLNADFITKLAGRVKSGHDLMTREGKIAGGKCYGYDLVPGQPGVRKINEAEATIIRRIFTEVARIMKRGSNIVVQADNLPGRTFTPLVRDFGTVISEVFRAEAEIVVAWDGGRKDYRHTHCLVFKAG
jgi:hypothetical protein